MEPTDIVQGQVWEGGDVTTLARIKYNGANAVKTDFSAIARRIFDMDSTSPKTATNSTTLTVNSVVFSTLQTDGRWDTDTGGYNFRDRISSTHFPLGDRRYRVEYRFTGTASEKFPVVFQVTTKDLWST